MVQFLSINFFPWISSVFVGFFKSSCFFVSPCIYFPNGCNWVYGGECCNVLRCKATGRCLKIVNFLVRFRFSQWWGYMWSCELTPYCLVGCYFSVKGTYCNHILTLNVGAVFSHNVWVFTYHFTWCHNTEDHSKDN